MKRETIRDTDSYTDAIMGDPEVADYIRSRAAKCSLRRLRLYVVTGKMIAEGARLSGPRKTDVPAQATIDEHQTDRLFAYRLHELTLRRMRGQVIKIMLYKKNTGIF